MSLVLTHVIFAPKFKFKGLVDLLMLHYDLGTLLRNGWPCGKLTLGEWCLANTVVCSVLPSYRRVVDRCNLLDSGSPIPVTLLQQGDQSSLSA